MKLINQQIQYVEFTCTAFAPIKNFYSQAFDWQFTDYGEDYVAFDGEHVDGGFYIGEVKQGSILPILYAENLETAKTNVKEAGGTIVREIFPFPGGRRFHFTDPSGNELAVWSDK